MARKLGSSFRKAIRTSRHRITKLGFFEQLEKRRVFAAVAAGDFNGDGFEDAALGVPFEDIGTIPDAGAVNVLYGSASGLAAAQNQFWHQNSPGIGDSSEEFDSFGTELAVGDFNNDGHDDLAIGIPSESFGVKESAGAVQIIYGSASGLTATGSRFIHQDVAGLPGTTEAGDLFGSSLTTGDFNGDDFDDIAIGAPTDSNSATVRGGTVTIILGSATGLRSTGIVWSQNSSGIIGTSASGDGFGAAVVSEDFDGDGFDDLAIGAPRDVVNGVAAGGVNVIFGSSTGLNKAGNQYWSQNSPGILDVAQNSDAFGAALTAGDYNGDTFADLAIGVPAEDTAPGVRSGAVNVLKGGSNGLTSVGNQFVKPQGAENFQSFGAFLATGDFNDDNRDDLVVGSPFDTIGIIPAAGSVTVIPGAPAGLSLNAATLWSQNSTGILDVAEAFDSFGVVTAGDFNGDRRDDLVVGVPGESIGTVINAGGSNVIYGATTGLNSANNQFWSQNSPGILDVAEEGDASFVFAFSFADVYANDIVELRKSRTRF